MKCSTDDKFKISWRFAHNEELFVIPLFTTIESSRTDYAAFWRSYSCALYKDIIVSLTTPYTDLLLHCCSTDSKNETANIAILTNKSCKDIPFESTAKCTPIQPTKLHSVAT